MIEFMIGVVVGAVIGIFIVALVSANDENHKKRR